MKVFYGLQNEAYKLVWGYNSQSQNVTHISDFSKSINAISLKNSTAAFQIVLYADDDYAINVGKSNWISQQSYRKCIRVAVDAPFETELNIIDMYSRTGIEHNRF